MELELEEEEHDDLDDEELLKEEEELEYEEDELEVKKCAPNRNACYLTNEHKSTEEEYLSAKKRCLTHFQRHNQAVQRTSRCPQCYLYRM